MHLIDNIKLRFKFGIIWSDSAHVPPGTCQGNPAPPRLNTIVRDRSI